MAKNSNPFFDTKERVWNGMIVNSNIEKDAALGPTALSALLQNPSKIIQICDTTGEKLTCQQMATFSKRVAQYLEKDLGLQQNDVVGIMGRNTTYLTPVVLGAFLSGTIIHAVYFAMKREYLKYVFGSTKPKVVFCDADYYDELVICLEQLDLQCKIVTLKGHISGVDNVQEILKQNGREVDFTPVELKNGGEQIAVILCTSGTTGIPKLVCFSHEILLNLYTGGSPENLAFTFGFIHWLSGLSVLLRSSLNAMPRVITDRYFTPEFFLELIEKYKITIVAATTYMVTLVAQCPDLARRDLSSVKAVVAGGHALSEYVFEKFTKHLGNVLHETYGITALGGIITWNGSPREKKGSVGRLVPNLKVKILSEDGKPMQIGELGELYVQRTHKVGGNYENPELTRLAIDSQGWFKTRDYGYFDEDGYLFICGRKQDLLKNQQITFSPKEIEEVIQKMPGVIEVSVFGVRDVAGHDLATAAVIKSDDCDLTEEDICKNVASCLPKVKQLQGGVIFVQDLPRSPSGKIRRYELLTFVDSINNN